MTAPATLSEALLAFQANPPKITREGRNEAYKGRDGKPSRYATLGDVMDAALPALTAVGLVFTTLPGRDQTGEPSLAYRLIHATTGEALAGEMPLLLTKQDPQGMGSALTYAKRQAIMAVLGLVADDDDDGNAASGGQARSAPTGRGERLASDKQQKLISFEGAKAQLSPLEFLNALRVGSGNDAVNGLSKADADAAAARLLVRLPARFVDDVLTAIRTPGGSDIPTDMPEAPEDPTLEKFAVEAFSEPL